MTVTYLFSGKDNNTVHITRDDGVSSVTIEPNPQTRPAMDTASIIGLVIWFACVLYSSIRSSSNAQAARYILY